MLRLLVAPALVAALMIGCTQHAVEPLQLERGTLTVNNDTSQAWTNVEIWLNQQFRVTVPSIEAKSRFQVSLGSFVEGYGRRFDFAKMQIKDVRLTAKTADGAPVEIKKAFQKGGLAGAMGGKS